jgi:hypothetical protein
VNDIGITNIDGSFLMKKKEKKKLKYFEDLEYDVVLRKKNDTFVLFIEELNCFAQDKDPKEAYEKLKTEKRDYFNQMIALDRQHLINEPESSDNEKLLFNSLLPFCVKFIIVLIAGLMLLHVGSLTLQKSLSFPLNKAVNQGLYYRARLLNMPEERKEEIKVKIRETVRELKPFINEFYNSLIDETSDSFSNNEDASRK